MKDVVCVLTPPGNAALATLGLAGPGTWDILRGRFEPRRGGQLPETPVVGRYWLGRLGGDLADDVVLAVRRIDPVPVLALHCHGGREVSRYLVELLSACGAQPCGWEVFVQFEEDDPFRATAAMALARAPTMRTAGILLDQYHGALRIALERIHALIAAGDRTQAGALLKELARWATIGRHLTQPFRVVIAGAPNVGKSSLVNALAGYQRSIVSPRPGTTRDVVTTTLAIDGWPVELADTAGLRSGGESLEQLGIEQARTAVAAADVCLWVIDSSAEPVWPGPGAEAVYVVINKIDLPAVWDLSQAGDAPRVSAATGQGMGELCAALSRWLVPEAPPPGVAVPITQDQERAIEDAIRRVGNEP